MPEERRKLAEQLKNRPDDDGDVQMNVDDNIHNDLLNYRADKASRDVLKRSLAKNSMG